jgi:hypothetical protein
MNKNIALWVLPALVNILVSPGMAAQETKPRSGISKGSGQIAAAGEG